MAGKWPKVEKSHREVPFTMRVPLIAGNWKMNKTIKESLEFSAEFSRLYFGKEIEDAKRENSPDEDLSEWQAGEFHVEVLFCPPFTSIPALCALFSSTGVKIGAQDVFWEEKGAFTGEISPTMLKDAGAEYVIIGHSERRQYFGETDETCSKKVRAVLDRGMKPILCVGETLSQRESGDALNVVEVMTKEGLRLLKAEEVPSLVIAYEPVWAIGTGKEAKPDDAKEVIAHIRKVLDEMFSRVEGSNARPSESVRVLYGGSVNPSNIRGFMREPEIDGALVGGASLDPDKFHQLIIETKKVRRS